MSTSATAVRFGDVTMWVDLTDGRTIGVPLPWFPLCYTRRRSNGRPAGLRSPVAGCIGKHWTRISQSRVCWLGAAI
jgi:hypothetical protein